MANLMISSKVEELPPTYVLPTHERPLAPVPIVKEIPLINLGEERTVVTQQFVNALEEYGFFEVINHGVPEDLMGEAIKVYGEFFNLSVKEKENYADKAETLYTNNTKHYVLKAHKYWKEVLENNYNIDGLGLEAGYFGKGHRQRMFVNHYLICPDPSSTLGTGGHCDPNLITIFQQVYGLQILKNDEWIGGEPLPHAFVVMTNGKLKCVAHRVVTNTTQARTVIGTYFCPADVVEPAKSFVSPDNPPLFTPFKWGTEFLSHYFNNRAVYHAALEAFKINA
ncbi:hypothetical protein KY284_026533 [Solanum tuberosum]|nr:hypothetical protein KY284_026533 [Solanum tuberosum]